MFTSSLATNIRPRAPLFIFGPARGGTTLVSRLMEKWFDYGTAAEGTFVADFIHRRSRYGDLNAAENLNRLARDLSQVEMLHILRHRYREVSRRDITAQDILKRIQQPTLGDAIYAVFEAVADHYGNRRVGNKNPDYWKILPDLERLYPGEAQYLFVVRDGRDVYLSQLEHAWGRQSAYMVAKKWVEMVQTCAEFKKTIEPGRFFVLKYEDLLSQPECTFSSLKQFLNLPNLSNPDFELIGNTPLRGNNFGKWRTQMSKGEQHTFEAVAGRILNQLDYETIWSNPTIARHQQLVAEVVELWRLSVVNFHHYKQRVLR